MWPFLWKRIRRELLVQGAFFLHPRRRIALERWHRGLEEWRRLQQADAVVVSYGKSGRTWLRVLISRYYQLRCGLSGYTMMGFDNLHRKDPRIPKILFTHDNYLADYTGHRSDKRDYYGSRVILLVRDPRDVAVSQFFQWKYRMRPAKKRINDYPLEDVDIYTFVMGKAGLPKIVAFMNGWARELDRVPQLHLLRYEDLRADTRGELRRLLAFLGEEPSEEELEDCVAFASVDNMRRLEAEGRFWRAGVRLMPKDRSNPDSYKVRRAKVGGWRDYFEDDQIRAIDAFVAERLDPAFGYGAAGVPDSERPRALSRQTGTC